MMESEDAKERKEKDGLRLTLIHNGVIVTMDDESRVYSNGAIVVEGDRIRAIGRSSEILDCFSPLAHEIVDLQGRIVLPGFVKMRGGGERTEGQGLSLYHRKLGGRLIHWRLGGGLCQRLCHRRDGGVSAAGEWILTRRSMVAFTCTFLANDLRKLAKETDQNGNTVLHLSVKKGSIRLMNFILKEKAAGVNVCNKAGKTALNIAIEEHRHPESEQMIVDLREENGMTGREVRSWPRRELPDEQLHGVLNTTVVIAVLIATLAFSTWMNPPGGAYQDGPLAGRAILSTRPLFPAFLAFNMVALLSSLVIVVTQSNLVAFTGDRLIYRWVVLRTLLAASTACILMDYVIAAW